MLKCWGITITPNLEKAMQSSQNMTIVINHPITHRDGYSRAFTQDEFALIDMFNITKLIVVAPDMTYVLDIPEGWPSDQIHQVQDAVGAYRKAEPWFFFCLKSNRKQLASINQVERTVEQLGWKFRYQKTGK